MKREISLAFMVELVVLSSVAFAQTNISPFTPPAQSSSQPPAFSPAAATTPAAPASDQPDYYFEEDVTTEYKVAQGDTVSKTIHQKMELKDGQMLRVDNPEENAITIVRLDKKMVYLLNTNQKTYTELNFQALKIKANQNEIRANQGAPQKQSGMEAARAAMLQSMGGVSPEQRAIMMQNMGKSQGQKVATDTTAPAADASAPQPVVLAQTADFMDILGHKCQRVKFTQGQKKLLEAWVTDKTGPQNYLSAFVENFDIFNADLVAEMHKVNGFPMQMKYRVQKGPLKDTIQSTNIIKIEQKELPPADFEIPAGYRSETTPSSGGAATSGKEESF